MDAIQKICLGRVNINRLFMLSMQTAVKDNIEVLSLKQAARQQIWDPWSFIVKKGL